MVLALDNSASFIDYTPAQLERLERQMRRSNSRQANSQGSFRLLRAPILHTPVSKDSNGTARITDLDSKYPVGKHLRKITEIFQSMPYFFQKPSEEITTWFKTLVENLNKFPRELEPILKTTEGRLRKFPMTIYSWLDSLIRDEGVIGSKKERLYALEQNRRTVGLGIGEFSELRVELALRLMKESGEIRNFYMARNSHVNDKLGIDALIDIDNSNGRLMLIPLQIKSSDQMVNSFSTRKKTFILNPDELRSLMHSQKKRPRKPDYNSIDFSREFQFKRKIRAVNGCDYSITDTVGRINQIITDSVKSDQILRVRSNFNDIGFAKKLSVLLQQKFIVPWGNQHIA